ncbi:MAG TPA: CoA transferase [Acidimicrobiales bacterium]|nr:CoA transferase [Acidimicrobiales bacterium]
MKVGDVANEGAAPYGKPLDGIRVLAAEQMQALPYATQLLARLGADVVKVEPISGESGRGAQPSMRDPDGRVVGATFLRNNLGKRSIALDLKSERGRDLFLDLVPRFDVVAENFKAGTMDRFGLGYDVLAARHPAVIYLSISGFGASGSPYSSWPAYAPIVEAMSGIYEYLNPTGLPPRAAPVGALGDISAALFASIGVLAALRHRDATGEGQQVDIAMYDSAVAMTDIVMNLASLGQPKQPFPKHFILDTFRAADGWFVMQLVREHQFAPLAHVVGRPEWIDDPRLATRESWGQHLEDIIRPGVEAWAANHSMVEASKELTAAGVAAGPCFHSSDVITDAHLDRRNMIVEMDRVDGVEDPVLIPGNPVKLSKMAEGPETRVPWVGEHTVTLLREELGLSESEVAHLLEGGVIAET